MRVFWVLTFLLISDVALASEVCMSTDAVDIGKFLGILAAAMAVLRPISATLGKMAESTETKWDNKAAKGLSKLVGHLGWFLGMFTIGNVPVSASKRMPAILAKKPK